MNKQHHVIGSLIEYDMGGDFNPRANDLPQEHNHLTEQHTPVCGEGFRFHQSYVHAAMLLLKWLVPFRYMRAQAQGDLAAHHQPAGPTISM